MLFFLPAALIKLPYLRGPRAIILCCVKPTMDPKPCVMVSPLPCSGVMTCSKCPLIIPGRRYRLPGWGFSRPFVQKTRPASEQTDRNWNTAYLDEDSLFPSLRRRPASKQTNRSWNRELVTRRPVYPIWTWIPRRSRGGECYKLYGLVWVGDWLTFYQ